jgi:type II secretory pathway pseudopilin PulG
MAIAAGRAQSERGYAMIALLVVLSVMAVTLSVALPVYSTMARREREAELVFRGQQYARAVNLFQRKYANALPPNLDVLLNERFLRKQYKDPITGGDFQVVGPGSPELALALNTAPTPQGQQGQQGRGGPPMSQQQPQPVQQGRGFQSNPLTAGQAPGGILGVVSKSGQTSLRIYNGRDKYNQWVFIPTQMSTAAGAGAAGGQAPGGVGGPAGRGRGQQPDGRGRGQQPNGRGAQPFGGPGPGPGFPRPQAPPGSRGRLQFR